MLKELEFKNYKLFKSMKMEGLAKVNLISGKNNSGKTSLLEGIFSIYDRGAHDLPLRQLSWRGINRVKMDLDSVWGGSFFNNNIHNQIKISGKRDNGKEDRVFYKVKSSEDATFNSYSSNLNQNYSTSKMIGKFLEAKYLINGIGAGTCNVTFDGIDMKAEYQQVKAPGVTVVFLGSWARNNNIDNINRLGELDVDGRKDEIISELKMLVPELRDLSIVLNANEPIIYADVGKDKKVPLAIMGEGVSKLLGVFLAILTNKGGLVLIDEIENGIHYSAFEEIWGAIFKLADKYSCQVFVATHSYEAMVGLANASSNNDFQSVSYYRLDKTDDGVVSQHYDFETFKTAIESEWEVR